MQFKNTIKSSSFTSFTFSRLVAGVFIYKRDESVKKQKLTL